MSKPPNQASLGWSFNSRSRTAAYDSDSDDSDSGENNLKDGRALEQLSEDAQLLKDLDLSTRSETAEYKPNPFNIAKINAASRPRRESTSGDRSNPIGKPVKKKTAPHGRIVDSFKRQASRPTNTLLKPDAPIGVTNKHPSPLKTLIHPNATKIVSNPQVSRLKTPASSLNPTMASNYSGLPHNSTDDRHTHSPIQSTLDSFVSPSAILRGSDAHPFYTPRKCELSSLPRTHLFSQSFSSPPAQAQRYRPEQSYAQSSPIQSTQRPFLFEVQKRSYTNGPLPEIEYSGAYMHPITEHSLPYVQNEASMREEEDKYATHEIAHFPIGLSDTELGDEPQGFSLSGLDATSERSGFGTSSNIDLFSYSSPAAVASPVSTNPRRVAPIAPQPLQASQSQQYPRQNKRFRSPLLSRGKPESPAQQLYTECPPSAHRRPEHTPRPAVEPGSNCDVQVGSAFIAQTCPNVLQQQREPEASTPTTHLKRRCPPGPSQSSSPAAFDICVPSAPKKKRGLITSAPMRPPHTASTTNVRDAYSFEPSPEELWSTLPTRKKPIVPKKEFGMKASGKFRMPINLGSGKKGFGKSTEATGNETRIARRVVTYLPPPQAKPEVKPLPKLIEQAGREEIVYTDSGTGEDETPSRCLADIAEATGTNSEHASQQLGSRLTRCPSKSPQHEDDTEFFESGSSPTLVEHRSSGSFEEETSMKLESIIERYPQTRAAMRKRRHLAYHFKDLLGLDSCGVDSIYRDSCAPEAIAAARDQEKWEVPIVVWKGEVAAL
ncbi:hypothetical protein HWV62_10379 [Athelia sp. TMB]|nr:hypothetical protein HWV62_10379 [Athelia sp. TMB]